MSKEKLTATHITYDNGKVLTDFAKYDNEGNEIANTYAKKKYTQEPLVSGYNIKTINGESILGSGNISLRNNIPECPATTDGTYVLEATVSNGKVTYNWVLKQ